MLQLPQSASEKLGSTGMDPVIQEQGNFVDIDDRRRKFGPGI